MSPMSWREFAFFLAGLALGFTLGFSLGFSLGWPELVGGFAAMQTAIGG